MEDDSRGARDGRTFWSGIRALIFGDNGESTLRDEIEEAIESREGEVPGGGDLSHVERQMLPNPLPSGKKNAGAAPAPRGDISPVPAETDFGALVAAFTEAGHSRMPVFEGSLD